MRPLSFDIFCRVVDNYGDIGVCWRLTRQLAGMAGVAGLRLWVDDLATFARIAPRVKTGLAIQYIDVEPSQSLLGQDTQPRSVEIRHWTAQAPLPEAHDIVVEAFACDPPADFIDSMVRRDSLWINLEYLSAEDWVTSCHALPSLQRNGLRKAFFFPGFTPGTGGLLREAGLLIERDRWQADPTTRATLLAQLALPDNDIDALISGDARQILLFCYPDAPVQALVDTLNAQQHASVILVPTGVCPGLARGRHANVTVRDIPFLDQAGFDRLLWSSDLNCVRGEDSLVRALWAGRPLLWHIYAQQDLAHMAKLQAWLDLSPFRAPVRQAMTCWNSADGQGFAAALENALLPAAWGAWQAASASWSRQLAQQTDLATSLLAFCAQANARQKR